MASMTEQTRALPPTTPKKVLAAIHNLPRRMRSGTFRAPAPTPAPPMPQHQPQPALPLQHQHQQRSQRARGTVGKENTPPTTDATAVPPPRRRRPAPLLPKSSKHIFGLGLGALPSPRDLDAPSPPASSGRFPTPPFSALHNVPHASPTPAAGEGGERWAPRGGQIVIKVWVPTTDDIWKVRVPAGTGLAAFRARVEAKLGFAPSFSAVVEGRLRTVGDEDAFRRWVAGRVREGRNTLLTAHRLELQ
ncbi:hypothetical protein C8Q77DRAFT_1156606 [Trametes polyzona]|nr:hypothetical protein C8Q77DRAFT_1156606 [Trametes polyzona]